MAGYRGWWKVACSQSSSLKNKNYDKLKKARDCCPMGTWAASNLSCALLTWSIAFRRALRDIGRSKALIIAGKWICVHPIKCFLVATSSKNLVCTLKCFVSLTDKNSNSLCYRLGGIAVWLTAAVFCGLGLLPGTRWKFPLFWYYLLERLSSKVRFENSCGPFLSPRVSFFCTALLTLWHG